jgi:prepilin-type N-terminal cleavage/methylation domain-containing protein
MKRGYTLVEVLVAFSILSILAVPLGYVLSNMSKGSRASNLQDEALDLAREDWTLVRATDPDSLRDTTWERTAAGGSWRIARDVFDSADRAAAGLPKIQSTSPAPPPVEISVCALHLEEERWDTLRCFKWLRPRQRILP